MTEHYILNAGAGFINMSPMAFHRWATHYYKCRQDFQSPHSFSPVPYFLLCRAIELGLKSKHLEDKRQQEVKNEFGHNLAKSYQALPVTAQQLSVDDFSILEHASAIYASKGFEYFNPEDALTSYSRFPDIAALDSIAKRLIDL
ncbi:MAG: hypothetical protein KJ795_13010 [Gammaproteobacteria bacterium]|nr:hypothetical protein [Gammaproteobacteria bacterium]MBU1777364.1 hypothetical protein [Gammaproteobacteria bacterium]MBU1968297.1 hypothetical protein [Gammaproteobacteria bacterium]